MKVWLALFVLVVSGCLGADAPGTVPADAEPPGVIDKAPTQPERTTNDPPPPNTTSVFTVKFQGLILARPGSSRDTIYEGDSPSMHFQLPENTTKLDATLSWDPPQDMGLEFWDAKENRYTSWGDDIITPQIESPIKMTFDDEITPGQWTVFLGPRAVGGGVEWELQLDFTIHGPPPDSLEYEG